MSMSAAVVEKTESRRDERENPLHVSSKGPVVAYALSHETYTVPQLVEYGVLAERAGFKMAWTSDHFQPWQDNQGHSGLAWVTMAALTQRTTHLAFGTGVTCPTFRYLPAIVAEAWASLSHLAPGRVFLGLGTGENLNEGASGGGWGKYRERSERLVEAIKIIRDLWTGERVKFKGKYWDVDAKLYDKPASPIPIYIAAGGPKSARMAGLHGDGLIGELGPMGSNPAYRAAWEEGARESGKNPATLPIIVEMYAVVGGEREARQSADLWHFGPKAWTHGYFDEVNPLRIQQKAEREIPLESVYKDWPVGTDPEIHVKAIQRAAAKGATHVVITTATPNQEDVIDFYGTKVLPRLRS
ncbi:MAG: TIGR03557 family F420-dependent LLM class oxidoreductase [Thaumarchaeota archaeon]|nr:TIGR03557 family F420-dependent LLM class oxidoreductase [Nitrososphaerota archaeon]